jgi:hypothetical protein
MMDTSILRRKLRKKKQKNVLWQDKDGFKYMMKVFGMAVI